MSIPVLARGAELAGLTNPRKQLVGAGIAVCALAIVLFRTVTVATHANEAILFQTGIYSPCEEEGANCRALDSLSQQADEGARIFLAEFYRDWLRVDLLQCVSDGDEFRALEASPTSEEGWSYLFERGFEYVAINHSTHAFIGELLDINLVPEWLDASQTSDSGFRVIHLSSKDPTRKPGISCQQVDPPAWETVPVD
jgi:hypothetical protein